MWSSADLAPYQGANANGCSDSIQEAHRKRDEEQDDAREQSWFLKTSSTERRAYILERRSIKIVARDRRLRRIDDD